MSSKQNSIAVPQAVTFNRSVTITIEANNRRKETIKIHPGGPTGGQFEVVLGMDFAPVLPQRLLLPLFASPWDQAFVMIAAAATEPAIPVIPFVQPTMWRRATVHMPDFARQPNDSLKVTVESKNWIAKMTGSSREPAQAIVPESSMRFLTVGWILAEMSSRLAIEQPGFEQRLAAQSHSSEKS